MPPGTKLGSKVRLDGRGGGGLRELWGADPPRGAQEEGGGGEPGVLPPQPARYLSPGPGGCHRPDGAHGEGRAGPGRGRLGSGGRRTPTPGFPR